jgi:4-hydroxybenzoate polyprenyltransferase
MRTIFYMLRVPNLLIIALTFLMLRYLVFIPAYSASFVAIGMSNYSFLILTISTLLIAASGYISNDYFDVASDLVNKPGKQYIGKLITPGTALASALLLSFLAVVLAIWLTRQIKNLLPAILLLMALFVVWWYAFKLKKSFLWGNIAVACMSAGTIGMAWLVELQISQITQEVSILITKIVAGISIFAFLLSLMREIVKDIEDIEGDKLINCKSLPIVKGIPFTKTILYVLLTIIFVMLIITQVYLFQFQRFVAMTWLLICVELPVLWFTLSLRNAQSKADYHKLSTSLKFIMLGGLLTMVAGQF